MEELLNEFLELDEHWDGREKTVMNYLQTLIEQLEDDQSK